ncbi:hypothetical protein BGZ58_009905 [Dissophora ornata]|nr:hypothetical protein BGZ58_009905 [Dissophora ornata]
MLITNSTLSEYFNVGVVAPTLQVWTDEDGSATGLAIEESALSTLALLMVVVFRVPSSSGSWSYYIGALGAFINTEPLKEGLTIKLWRSEAAGLDDSAQPLAERDTTARL